MHAGSGRDSAASSQPADDADLVRIIVGCTCSLVVEGKPPSLHSADAWRFGLQNIDWKSCAYQGAKHFMPASAQPACRSAPFQRIGAGRQLYSSVHVHACCLYSAISVLSAACSSSPRATRCHACRRVPMPRIARPHIHPPSCRSPGLSGTSPSKGWTLWFCSLRRSGAASATDEVRIMSAVPSGAGRSGGGGGWGGGGATSAGCLPSHRGAAGVPGCAAGLAASGAALVGPSRLLTSCGQRFRNRSTSPPLQRTGAGLDGVPGSIRLQHAARMPLSLPGSAWPFCAVDDAGGPATGVVLGVRNTVDASDGMGA